MNHDTACEASQNYSRLTKVLLELSKHHSGDCDCVGTIDCSTKCLDLISTVVNRKILYVGKNYQIMISHEIKIIEEEDES